MKKNKLLTLIVTFALFLGAGFIDCDLFCEKAEASYYYQFCTKTIDFDNSMLNWDEVYAYQWNTTTGSVKVARFDKVEGTQLFTGILDSTQDYDMCLFKNTPGNDNWDQQSTDMKSPCGGMSHYYLPEKINENNKVEGIFTNSIAKMHVFYKNDNFGSNAPYIHYKVNDTNWTVAPGYKMKQSESREGYYEFDIYLLYNYYNCYTECCFSDGEGNYDNNYSHNYILDTDNKGTSENTFVIKNGTVQFEVITYAQDN